MEANFLLKTNHESPPHNKVIFEEFFADTFLEEKPSVSREYIPVCWTNYYVAKDYCNNDMSDLQNYLDGLNRSKKYFTVCQWDDGIVNDIEGLDLFIFSSGGVGHYSYPLNCLPHPPPRSDHPLDRDFIYSFVGAIRGRHQVRQKMNSSLPIRPDVFISERLSFGDFQAVLHRSLFSLCPRGYGKTSFRICESLQAETIPVYIYDDPWIPFNDMVPFEEYGILCHIDDIDSLDQRLQSISTLEAYNLISRGAEVYDEYYSYDGCYSNIIKKLKELP